MKRARYILEWCDMQVCSPTAAHAHVPVPSLRLDTQLPTAVLNTIPTPLSRMLKLFAAPCSIYISTYLSITSSACALLLHPTPQCFTLTVLAFVLQDIAGNFNSFLYEDQKLKLFADKMSSALIARGDSNAMRAVMLAYIVSATCSWWDHGMISDYLQSISNVQMVGTSNHQCFILGLAALGLAWLGLHGRSSCLVCARVGCLRALPNAASQKTRRTHSLHEGARLL